MVRGAGAAPALLSPLELTEQPPAVPSKALCWEGVGGGGGGG